MFEWKPPDPRLVALVRRLEAALLRRFPANGAAPDPSTGDEDVDAGEPSGGAAPDTSASRVGDPPSG